MQFISGVTESDEESRQLNESLKSGLLLQALVKLNRTYPINVKVPQEYVNLIDENLKTDGVLAKMGLEGRAEVVRHAVFDFLRMNGIQPTLDPKYAIRRRRYSQR